MTITAGSRLGPYEIVTPLGSGGMGEVYKARDTRLAREVVVKTLRSEVASDAERVRRFEQEARSASALNHPNIVSIYDIGSQDGTLYIAMELVEGTTLRELLASGEPLPIRKTLELSTQIAEGLARAHSAGIVHRDLKPENVIYSKDGFVKILDFGLAKLAPLPAEGGSALATAAAPETTPGTVMGTVGYMSPEQASGREIDYRSDQFSLGSVLYEMATGKRAFRRNTSAETLTAIIREEPEPVQQSNPKAPAPLRWILERCLAKDPEDRYASTKDLARDLRAIRDHLSETSVSASAEAVAAPVRRTRLSRWLPLAAIAALGALAIGYFLGGRRPASHSRPQLLTYRKGAITNARFTPDGQTVVYSQAADGKPMEVFAVRLGNPESRPLGLPGASLLAVSASEELALSRGWRYIIGWEARGTLAQVPLSGGAPRELLEDVQEADWSPDGKALAVIRQTSEGRILEYPIGRTLHKSLTWMSRPRVSPDGKRVAFFEHPEFGDNIGHVFVVDESGQARRVDVEGVNSFAWAPGGDDLWITRGTPAGELARVKLDGSVRTAAQMPGVYWVQDVARDGRLLLQRWEVRREIVALPPGETRERNLTWFNWSYPCALSSDGRTAYFEEQNVGLAYQVYSRATDGTDAIRLGTKRCLSLTPDGRWLLTVDQRERDQLVLLPTGPGEPRPLPKSQITYAPWANVFPDGRRLLTIGSEPGREPRLYVQDLDGPPRVVGPEGIAMGRWDGLSPDGMRVAALDRDRRVRLYPVAGGEPTPVPGLEPDEVPIRWSADGRELYVARHFEVPLRIFLVDVSTGRRRHWKTLDPPDPAGVLQVGPVFITPDGTSYLYSYRRELGELWLVEGLR
jgi:tRNA A-37 threonylcarbamoyl transferase component Bud32